MLLFGSGLKRSTTNKLILFAIVLLCLCFVILSVDATYKYHKKFAKHLYKFLKKEKKFFKKKGLEAAALLALGGYKKKLMPLPVPLPIPIIHQPIIHEPVFMGKFTQKAVAKGIALDLLTQAKLGGIVPGAGIGYGGGGVGLGGGFGGGLGGGLGLGGIGLGGGIL